MLKRLPVVALAVLVVLVGGAYYYAIGTPQYSLYMLRAALEEKDMDAVEKYVDIEAVTDSTVEAIYDVMLKQSERDLKGNPFGAMAMGLLALMKPQMKEMARGELRKSFRSGLRPDGESQVDWSKVRLESVQRDGKVAEATIVNPDGEKIRLLVRQAEGRYWRIVEVPTFTELLNEAMEKREQGTQP